MNSATFPALQGGTDSVQMWKHTAVQQDSGATADGAPKVDPDSFRRPAEHIRRELWQGKHQQKVQAAGQWHGEPRTQSGGNRPADDNM